MEWFRREETKEGKIPKIKRIEEERYIIKDKEEDHERNKRRRIQYWREGRRNYIKMKEIEEDGVSSEGKEKEMIPK